MRDTVRQPEFGIRKENAEESEYNDILVRLGRCQKPNSPISSHVCSGYVFIPGGGGVV